MAASLAELSVAVKRLDLELRDQRAAMQRVSEACDAELDGLQRQMASVVSDLARAILLLNKRTAAAPAQAPAHQWSGTRLRFANPDGSWGAWTDLQGPRGERGPRGGGGAHPFDLNSLPAGDASTPTEIVLKQHDVWDRVSWAQFLALIGSEPAPSPRLDFSRAGNSQYIGALHL